MATAAAVDLSVGREQPMPQFVEARAGAGTASRQVTASAATRPASPETYFTCGEIEEMKRGRGRKTEKELGRNKGVGRALASY